jgi:hypothetical protein
MPGQMVAKWSIGKPLRADPGQPGPTGPTWVELVTRLGFSDEDPRILAMAVSIRVNTPTTTADCNRVMVAFESCRTDLVHVDALRERSGMTEPAFAWALGVLGAVRWLDTTNGYAVATVWGRERSVAY